MHWIMSDPISFSGAIPEKYDRYQGPVYFEPYAIDLVERIASSDIKEVLEIACGTGRVTHHLRQALPSSVKLIATDLNGDMLEFAKSRYKNEEIDWKIADAQDLPFADNNFDLVVCGFGYMFAPDKQKAFNEAYRVLKPGGQLLFNTWDKLEYNGSSKLCRQVVSKHFFNDKPPASYYLPYAMDDQEEIRPLLIQAGFRNIIIESVSKNGRSDSAMNIANSFIEGPLIYNAIRQRDPALVEELKNLVAKELAAKYGDAPLITPMQAIISMGWK
jgi:ubiquinone/menaquinone biosynthesis C-methylase UbiE